MRVHVYGWRVVWYACLPQTLQSNLSAAVSQYPKMQRAKWLMQKNGDDDFSHFAQNAVLAAAIWHVANVEKAFIEFNATGAAANPEAMAQYVWRTRSCENCELCMRRSRSIG